MRAAAATLLLHFLVVTFAPGWIVADFLIGRQRIAAELCVQRLVPEDMRSCHGECQLKKRLGENERQERNLPEDLRSIKVGELFAEDPASLSVPPPAATARAWAGYAEHPLEGHVRPHAPVPWC